jgi:8-oxo-dGTP diphosphatase
MHEYQYPRAANTASVIVYTRGSDWSHVMNVLTVVRGREPYKGMLALPGGFHDVGRETLEETAQRELREETGLVTEVSHFSLHSVQSDPQRDPREHVIDHVYSVYVPPFVFESARAGDDAEALTVLTLHQLGSVDKKQNHFAFDHGHVLQQFLNGFDWRLLG